MMRSFLGAIAMMWLMGTPTVGRALEDYAAAIAEDLNLDRKPHCEFCHAVKEDYGATDTAFGDALKSHGFAVRFGEGSLIRALHILDERDVDSDGDGVGDVDELRAGANPNDAGDAGHAAEGCNLGAARGATWPWLLLCGVWLARRRTRARVPPPRPKLLAATARPRVY